MAVGSVLAADVKSGKFEIFDQTEGTHEDMIEAATVGLVGRLSVLVFDKTEHLVRPIHEAAEELAQENGWDIVLVIGRDVDGDSGKEIDFYANGKLIDEPLEIRNYTRHQSADFKRFIKRKMEEHHTEHLGNDSL